MYQFCACFFFDWGEDTVFQPLAMKLRVFLTASLMGVQKKFICFPWSAKSPSFTFFNKIKSFQQDKDEIKSLGRVSSSDWDENVTLILHWNILSSVMNGFHIKSCPLMFINLSDCYDIERDHTGWSKQAQMLSIAA